MNQRVCVQCGRNFPTDQQRPRYCEPCKREKKRARERESYAKNPKPRKVKPKERACESCGVTFLQTHWRNTKYCSPRCKGNHWARSQYRENRQAILAEKATKRAARPQRPQFSKVCFPTCKDCGGLFTSKGRAARCPDCLKGHRREYARRHSERKHAEAVTARACDECGASFVRGYGDTRRNTCSAECRKKRNKRLGEPIRRAAKSKRRARERGLNAESFDPITEVFERDGWICYLCGTRLNPSLRGAAHPMAPEVEHVVPLSRGGVHTRGNAKCACRRCNSIKGDLLLSEIAAARHASEKGRGRCDLPGFKFAEPCGP